MNLHLRRTFRGVLVVVLASLLIIAGVVVYTSGVLSPEVNHLGEPFPVGVSAECIFGSLTVNHCALEAHGFRVDWSYDAWSDENLVIQSALNAESEAVFYDLNVDGSLSTQAAQTGRMRDGTYSAYSCGQFLGARPETPFDVTLTLWIVRPAELTGLAVTSATYAEAPTLLADDDLIIRHGNGREAPQLNTESAVGDRVWVHSRDREPVPGNLIAKLDVDFTVQPNGTVVVQ